MKKTRTRFWLGLPLVILIISLVLGVGFLRLSRPVESGSEETKRFVIARGEGVSSISARLKQEGLIHNVWVFRLIVQKDGLAKNIQAGSFDLSPSMTTSELAHHLTEGTNDIWITVLEGWRREEIAQYLAEQELDSFDPKEFEYLTDGLEGRLFPDTYLIPRQMGEQQIVNLLTRTFATKVTDGLKSEIAVSAHDFDDALVMASIVEREARGYEEMRVVAGILWNRVRIGMPLQADATLQYAKGYNASKDSWWEIPIPADKQISSPFNTYQNPGLPPRPISNPSFNAIRATLNPAETDYLYYLHDAQGGIHYAETLDQHNANVNQYLR